MEISTCLGLWVPFYTIKISILLKLLKPQQSHLEGATAHSYVY